MSRLEAKLTLQAGAGDGVLADLRIHGPPLLALLQEGILDQRRNIEAGEVFIYGKVSSIHGIF